MQLSRWVVVSVVGSLTWAGTAWSAELASAERGQKAMETRSFNQPAWSTQAYKNAWRQWDPNAKNPPVNYAEAFMRQYGLHPAPYANAGYPMGLKEASGLLGRGISNDCLICHGGSIAGQSYIGLGNSALDIQALMEDLAVADGRSPHLPFTFSQVRGTSEAGAMAVYLLALREPDLKLRTTSLDFNLRDDLCEDVPAWWLLKKKKTMYYTGSTNARSVRSLMQFMLSPLTLPSTFEREESTFGDIQAFILSLKPPKYPFPIDQTLAHKGEQVFNQTCSRCHGTYGEKWTYPNKIVPMETIGTDPNRYEGLSQAFGDYYNKTWFAHEKPGAEYQAQKTAGYQAPPLDGIWATAPYLHNGSVPTVYQLLNSQTRPKRFTRSYQTDKDAYDPVRLGWKLQIVDQSADPTLSPRERRKVYDTTMSGRGNRGHTFGDALSEDERMAVIEYLKTL